MDSGHYRVGPEHNKPKVSSLLHAAKRVEKREIAMGESDSGRREEGGEAAVVEGDDDSDLGGGEKRMEDVADKKEGTRVLAVAERKR